MTTELTLIKDSSLTEWTSEMVQVLKNTVCKGATDDELQIFKHVCRRTGLDPFIKQIHAVKRPDRERGMVMTIQTGIDGFRLIADRTGRYVPGKEPTYIHDAEGKLISATAYVKKQSGDGTWHEVAATAYWNEYVQTTKDGRVNSFWTRMPHGQLAKCAEALVLRKCFPADLSGLYTHEEMGQADNSTIVVKAERMKTEEDPQEAEKIINKFISEYPEDLKPHMIRFIIVCAEHKKTAVKELLSRYENGEFFYEEFSRWNTRRLQAQQAKELALKRAQAVETETTVEAA